MTKLDELLRKASWQWWLPGIAFILVFMAAGYWFGNRSPREAGLLNLKLEHLGGHEINLQSFKGQATVLNLWATWCAPCRRELPMMAEIARLRPDIHFVFIDQLETKEKVSKYLLEQDLNLEWVLLDKNGEVARSFQSKGLPTTLFFDAQGKLVKAHLGEISSVQFFNEVVNLTSY